MILAIDVGNTNIVLGMIENGEIQNVVRIHTDLRETGTEISLAGVPMEILIKGDGEFDKYEYMDIYRKQLGRQMTKLLLKIK